MKFILNSLILLCSMLIGTGSYAGAKKDPLASWNDGQIKTNIINFVTAATTKNSPTYVAPADRIAVFDNDGTLWVEQPIYTQVIFALSKIKELAPQHPEWRNEEPFKAIINDEPSLTKMNLQDFEKVIAVSHSGMSVADFQKELREWLAVAKNQHFNQLYTALVYQPMLEVMNYLRANDFKVYIVTGGGQDFVRAFAHATYGVSSEQVIGSTTKTKFVYKNGKPALIKLPEVLFVDDSAGKPQAINLFIGKKPLIAFGNSDGDQQMLEWTQSGSGKSLMLLVHHDDATREFAYDTESKVGTFSVALMDEARQSGWQVISMKQDWKVIFPFASPKH